MPSPGSSPVLRPARSLVVAPRLPDRPKEYRGLAESDGDIVADCTVDGCGYHVMGARADVKAALDHHHRLYHPEETVVVLLNTPSQ